MFFIVLSGMDEMEFTEAESNMNDLISEYQQYQVDSLCNVTLCYAERLIESFYRRTLIKRFYFVHFITSSC
jgi:hypothetical protein